MRATPTVLQNVSARLVLRAAATVCAGCVRVDPGHHQGSSLALAAVCQLRVFSPCAGPGWIQLQGESMYMSMGVETYVESYTRNDFSHFAKQVGFYQNTIHFNFLHEHYTVHSKYKHN